MLGSFQKSQLRIEVAASEILLKESLTYPTQIQKWLWPQRLSPGLPQQLQPGLIFSSWIGPVAVEHVVDVVEPHCLRLLLSKGIDGFHEWYWGEGWVQSRIEGISFLPLNLAHTFSLLQLKRFLQRQSIHERF
jgi:hypothetical protein